MATLKQIVGTRTSLAYTGSALSTLASGTYVQNTTGSLSRASMANHAVRGRSPNHSVRSVVLPNPAAAETNVSTGCSRRSRRTPSRRSGRRGRR